MNLVPYLTGEKEGPPHEVLFWRFWAQSAVRKGDWKFLKAGQREFLFQLGEDGVEDENLLDSYPEIAGELKALLGDWAETLYVPGIPEGPINNQEIGWYDFYFK